jgi:hypothetical protein
MEPSPILGFFVGMMLLGLDMVKSIMMWGRYLARLRPLLDDHL